MKPFCYLSSVGLACLPLLALAVGQWSSFALDNRVSVRLPGKPTSLKTAADEAAYPANRFCAAKDA